MSKIKVKSLLKTENEIFEFQGFGLKDANKITYFDNNIKTVLSLGEIITLKRTLDYEINLKFQYNKKLDGYYLNNLGKINMQTHTTFFKQDENKIEIHYTLLSNNQKIQDFEFILEYSIDT